MKLTKVLQRIPDKTQTLLFLGTAVLIFAASNSITRKIVQIGENNMVNGHNPISLCNVLFVGNLCSLAVMVCIFHHDWKPQILKALTVQNWIFLTLMGFLSGAIVPALVFSALGRTNVTNIVLIGRIEPILTLALGVYFLKSKINSFTILASLASAAGVIVTAFLKMPSTGGVPIPQGEVSGEVLVAIAAVIASISTIMGKLQLQSVPLGIFTIYRNVLGTTIFFFVANILYGPSHFAEVLSPFLWKWMILYASVIVVTGQLCWLNGLKKATPTELNLASLLNPVAAILMAYLILREVPTLAQYIGGSLLLLGLILGLIGNQHQAIIDQAAKEQATLNQVNQVEDQIDPNQASAERVDESNIDFDLACPSSREGMVMAVGFRGV